MKFTSSNMLEKVDRRIIICDQVLNKLCLGRLYEPAWIITLSDESFQGWFVNLHNSCVDRRLIQIGFWTEYLK